jgi:antitoxin component of MazEF toxin-antitoxin module
VNTCHAPNEASLFTLKRTLVKIGGSLRLTIPPEIAHMLRVHEGDEIEFSTTDGEVVNQKARARHPLDGEEPAFKSPSPVATHAKYASCPIPLLIPRVQIWMPAPRIPHTHRLTAATTVEILLSSA